MVDRNEKSDQQVIRDMREQLVSKNSLLRSIQSQVANPDRVRDRIRKKQEQVDILILQIHNLEDIISDGSNMVDQLIDDIENLEDRLSLKVHKSSIARLKRLVDKLESTGIDIQELINDEQEGRAEKE